MGIRVDGDGRIEGIEVVGTERGGRWMIRRKMGMEEWKRDGKGTVRGFCYVIEAGKVVRVRIENGK